MADFAKAAKLLVARGWLPIPLGLDARGKPKRPMQPGWTQLKIEDVPKFPWRIARGLGIVLGPSSGNLAAIDIDDNALARHAFAHMVRAHALTRMVWTTSRNIHIYVTERNPSSSVAFKVKYQGRIVGVELKAAGTQVAAPPTEGYKLATGAVPARLCDSIADAWASLAKRMDIEVVKADTTKGAAGYPRPFLDIVPVGDRNKAMFVEAMRLHDARMPFEQAVEHLRLRYEKNYAAGGMTWGEAERTIRSAYSRELPPDSGTEATWKGELA